MTRILITGSRAWTNTAMMTAALTNAVASTAGPVTLVHGAARGADQLAATIAPTLGPHVSCEPWPADWNGPCRPSCTPGHRRTRQDGVSYCPAAGAYRNQQMVNAGADLCLAFPLNDSPGTRDCMRRADAAGIPVIDIPAMTCAPIFTTKHRAERRAWMIANRAGVKPTPPTGCQRCNGWHAIEPARTAA